jgi:transcriptional regulator with XRE-family HTH domain
VEEVSVGENIRNARQKAGLTQAYLAELAGVTQAMLCQIERGTKNPSLQLGAEIAKILNCSLDSLLIGSGPSD